MSPNMFEPRRLRDSTERASSSEGRLARQLRVLSVYAPMPQFRRYSALPRRRRYILTTIRVAAVATIVLAVSGVATGTAMYVVRRVWPRVSAVDVDPVQGQPAQMTAKHRGSAHRVQAPTEGRVEAPAEAAGAGLQEPKIDVVAAGPSTPTASPEPPALPSDAKSRLLALRRSDSMAAQPHRSPEEAPPPVAAVESPAQPWVPLASGTAPTRTTSPAASGRAAVPVPTDGVTQEAGLLRQALSALRRDRDAQRALALLDDYDRRFGQGTLAWEAASVRAQALLQLGDNARALEFLDRLPLWKDGYTGELRVIRGELRSLFGRCRDALLDFDAVLRATAGRVPDEVARALFGRASCRARTGDVAGAEEDRQRYLKEFPQGPAARQLLSPR